jgi:hypothetical protein
MVKTMLSALLVVGIATTASANSVTSATKQAGNAVKTDVSSSTNGVSQVSSDAKNMAKASESLASLKASATAVAQRMKSVLSSQAAVVQKGDVESSTAAITAAPTAVKNDASSAASGTSNMTANTAGATSNSATAGLAKAAGKKAGAMSTEGKASVVKVAKSIASGLHDAATYSSEASVSMKDKMKNSASSQATTDVTNAISLKDSVVAMIETNEGEWNRNRDFNEAMATYTEEAKIASEDASFTEQDAIAALEIAVQL